MHTEHDDIDKIFRKAFEQANVQTPQVNQAWEKMHKKLYRRRQKWFLLISHSAANLLLFIVFLSFIKPMLTHREIKNDYIHTNTSSQYNAEKSSSETFINEKPEIHRITNDKKTTAENHIFSFYQNTKNSNNIEDDKHSFDQKIDNNSILTEFRNIAIVSENLPAQPIFGDDINSNKSSTNLHWSITVSTLMHNHWIVGGDFMGNNLPSIGILVSKNLKPNLLLTTGVRYLHRGNMDYATYSKTKEIYDQEQINFYTLYVNGTHWLEIPLGLQFYLPDHKVFLGGYITSDIFLHQSAELGVKTVVPALSLQTDERRKKAWNYDSGIPKLNVGIRTELGVYLNSKNSLNIFSKLSPYSGKPNANIQRNYGWDMGVEWRYHF